LIFNLFRVAPSLLADTGSTIEAGVTTESSHSRPFPTPCGACATCSVPAVVKNGRQLGDDRHTRSIPFHRAWCAGKICPVRRCAARPLIHLRSAMTFQCGLRDALEYLIMPGLSTRSNSNAQVTFHRPSASQARISKARILSGALGYGRHVWNLPRPGRQYCQRERCAKNSALMSAPATPPYSQPGQLSLQGLRRQRHVLGDTNQTRARHGRSGPGGFSGVNQRRVGAHCSIYLTSAAQVGADTDLLTEPCAAPNARQPWRSFNGNHGPAAGWPFPMPNYPGAPAT